MRVLVDAHMIGQQEGGNERYIVNLLRALQKDAKVDAMAHKVKSKKFGIKNVVIVSSFSVWRYLFEIPYIFVRNHYDLLFTTYFVAPFVARRNILMVHDLLPFRQPGYFSMKERLQFFFLSFSLHTSLAIIVPSRFVAQEITTFFPRLSSKVVVIAEAADPVFYAYPKHRRTSLRRHYRLQNFTVLIMASKYKKRPVIPVLTELQSTGFPITVFVSSAGVSHENLKNFSNLDIRFLPHLSDGVLRDYYNTVDAVIYPSKYEGFGLPVLEVMQCKTTIIASEISPIKEVAKNCPYYFSLDKPGSLTRVIRRIVHNRYEQRQKILLGYEQSRRYSWKKTAKLTYEFWQQTVQSL